MSYTNENIKWRSSYQNESTEHIKSSQVFVQSTLKKLANCCDFKELLQKFEENRFINIKFGLLDFSKAVRPIRRLLHPVLHNYSNKLIKQVDEEKMTFSSLYFG